MEHSRRQHYLAAMGIDCWVPQRQLPGAAPGRVCARKDMQQATALQEQPASPAACDSNERDSAAAQSRAGRLQQELAGAAPAKSPTPRVPRQPPAAGHAATSFQLAFYAWAPELLIVDQVLDARMQQQLISNLLFALGHANLQRNQPDYFAWPIPGGSQTLALSPQEMVSGVLQRLIEQHSPSNMVLMGALAAQHVLGTSDSEFVAGVQVDSALLYPGVSIVTTHSGVELLHNPPLKAETWRHLQILRA